jgi:hypothetical protein
VRNPNGKPQVLVFTRPYLIEDFQANVAPLAGSFQFHFLVDGKCPGVTDTRKRFYERLGKAPQPPGFTAKDELDVVSRCRYLRNLPRQQAIDMLRSMAAVFVEELDKSKADVVLSIMVDDYTTHVLSELARRRGINFVGYAYSYFPNRSQVTRYGNGEPLDLREPSDEEVAQTLEVISQRAFRQNYLQKDTYTRTRHLLAMLRYRVKRAVFRYKAWSDHDPLHVHYGCLPYVVERRHWRDFPSTGDFHGDWQNRLRSGPSPAGDRPVVYFPLGYFPEATIDYWIEDKQFLDYENTVLRICAALGQHCRLVVKEHLHMLGARSPSFYRAIRDTPGVISVPPLEFSNDVLQASDLVLMGAGSIGVEAFIRGKPIASFCDRSYWFAHSRAAAVELPELDRWPQTFAQTIRGHAEPSAGERFEFVRQCLRSTMRAQRPGKRWPICEPEDLERALRKGQVSTMANPRINTSRAAGTSS